jgi:hypothetical protein
VGRNDHLFGDRSNRRPNFAAMLKAIGRDVLLGL